MILEFPAFAAFFARFLPLGSWGSFYLSEFVFCPSVFAFYGSKITFFVSELFFGSLKLHFMFLKLQLIYAGKPNFRFTETESTFYVSKFATYDFTYLKQVFMETELTFYASEIALCI